MTAQQIIPFDKNSITEFDEFTSQMAKLKEDNLKVIFDFSDPKQNAAGRSHIHKLRKTKTGVGDVHKSTKARALEFGRAVDQKKNDIISDIEGMIEIHAKPLREFEALEDARKQGHIDSIGKLKIYLEYDANTPASILGELLEAVIKFSIDDSLEEFKDEADITRTNAIDELKVRLSQREQYEADQAELAERRRMDEEREAREESARILQKVTDAAAEEARIAKETKERDRIQAQNNKMLVFTRYKSVQIDQVELEKLEESLKFMREIDIGEFDDDFIRDAGTAQIAAILGLSNLVSDKITRLKEQADHKRLQDEETERKKQDEENHQTQLKLDQEAAEAKAKADDIEHQKTINKSICAALLDLGAPSDAARDIVIAIAKGQIPHLKIEY